MEKEKRTDFKVTDKRAVYQEATTETPQPKTSASESSAPAEVPEQAQSRENSFTPLPEANFLTLVFSFYTYAQISLGQIPDPMTQQSGKDLLQAKYHIDLLTILQEKTKGNLTKEEEEALEQILFELRMVYVEANK